VAEDLANRPITERYEHLLAVLSSRRFLDKQGLGNEVPHFICPFQPREAAEMAKLVKNLDNSLRGKGIAVLTIDLYDLAVDILQKRDEGEVWRRLLSEEADFGKNELKELLQNGLEARQHLIPAIAARLAQTPCDVLFLTGAGEVYPYIRSHNVLENLQSATGVPVVLFFPGAYTYSQEKGASLDLFGRLHDDKYYRAFNIYHYEV